MNNPAKIKCDPPKGMKDRDPQYNSVFNYINNIIEKCFKSYGGKQIDTPIVERWGTIDKLYGGEFDKLVYKLDEGHDEKLDQEQGEKLFLRYDLTVPFARYVANNGLVKYKRYQIGKVYRRDNPQIIHGRYREFYQADFDIIGYENSLIIDTEMISLLVNTLNKLIGANFIIKINHKDLLLSILSSCGIENDKICSVCSIIDKMDDRTIDETKQELLSKNIQDTQINKLINIFYDFNNIHDLNTKLEYIASLTSVSGELLNGLKNMFQILQLLNITNINFDIRLARGMDYYTGVIYEAVLMDPSIIKTTIAAGGRYDNLLGNLSNKGNINAIGLSIGIERIITIYKKTGKFNEIIKNSTNGPIVFIASVGKNMINHKLSVLIELKNNGIYAEMFYTDNPKMRQQLNYVFDNDVSYMLVLGEDEIKNNIVQVKNIKLSTQYQINRNDLLSHIQNLINS